LSDEGLAACDEVGFDEETGRQLKKDVDCQKQCNQLKIDTIWVTKSNIDWIGQGWVNSDNPEGTGDHESY